MASPVTAKTLQGYLGLANEAALQGALLNLNASVSVMIVGVHVFLSISMQADKLDK